MNLKSKPHTLRGDFNIIGQFCLSPVSLENSVLSETWSAEMYSFWQGICHRELALTKLRNIHLGTASIWPSFELWSLVKLHICSRLYVELHFKFPWQNLMHMADIWLKRELWLLSLTTISLSECIILVMHFISLCKHSLICNGGPRPEFIAFPNLVPKCIEL